MGFGLGGLSTKLRDAYYENMHRFVNFLSLQALLGLLVFLSAKAAIYDPFCNTGDLSPFMSEVKNELQMQAAQKNPQQNSKKNRGPVHIPELRTAETNFKSFSADYCKKSDAQKAQLLQEYASEKSDKGQIQKALNRCFMDCKQISSTYSSFTTICDKACGMVKQKIDYFNFGMSFQESLKCGNSQTQRTSSTKGSELPLKSRMR